MILAVVNTMLFFIPVVYIAFISYKDAGSSYFQDKFVTNGNYLRSLEQGDTLLATFIRFGDWCYLLMKRNDLGIGGLLIAITIQIQIYLFLFALQCATFRVKILVT